MIAETGLFYIQPMFHACVILWGLFGVRAIGLQTLLVMQVLTMVLTIDPRESLMPFMTNSLRLLEFRNVRLPRAAGWCAVAILLGLLVALPLSLYIQYDQGNAVWEGWADHVVPRMPFANVTAAKRTLAAQGLLEEARDSQGSMGLLRALPHSACVTAMLAGLALFLAFAVARLHLKWWPLHPLGLAITWSGMMVHSVLSVFIAWSVKAILLKIGGVFLYRRSIPFFMGLMIGYALNVGLSFLLDVTYFHGQGHDVHAY